MKSFTCAIFILFLIFSCKKSDFLDLNNDKNPDTVTYTLSEDKGFYTLKINDTEITGEGVNLSDNYKIVDINEFDDYKEICVEEIGTGDDRKIVTIYWYDGKEIQFSGMLQGAVSSLLIDGSGIILAQTKSQILQDWTFNDPYFLSDTHNLVRQPVDFYDTNYTVSVLNPLKLNTLPDEDSDIAFTLKVGEKATIVATDDNRWCLVKNSNGLKGWFGVINFDRVIGSGRKASYYFGDLKNEN